MRLKKIVAGTVVFSLLSINTFSGIFGGGGGASSTYWQMKTFYETVKVEANTVKQLRTKLEEMRLYLEQIKNLPNNVLKSELNKHIGMINDLVAIQNEVKGLLGDARSFEMYLKDMYKDVRNMDYVNLLDRYAETINDLSRQAANAQNPTQLLQVLNSWNANLSLQLSSVTDMINNNSRLQALEYLEKANQIKIEQADRQRMLELLDKRIKELRSKQKK